MTSPTTVTLGTIDDLCAITGENPVDVLELLLVSDAGSKFLATDTLEVVA